MKLCIENPKDSTKELLEVIYEFTKVTGYNTNTQKSVAFYTPIMNYQKGILRKQSHSQLLQKNKIPRNKPNQECKRLILGKL